MEFTPQVRKKGNVNHKLQVNPFPSCEEGKKFHGIFTGMSVEVTDKADISTIYECGGYGKGSKSRSAPQVITQKRQPDTIDWNETLVLDLEEAFFLGYFLDVLKIYNLEGNEMSWNELFSAMSNIKPNFMDCLAAYLYLKAKSWIVRTGTKFGGDFLIYKKGIRFYHASFVVVLSMPGKSKDYKGLQRVAESSGKDVIMLNVKRPPFFQLESLSDFEKLTISELIISRFNYTKYFAKNNKPKPKIKQPKQAKQKNEKTEHAKEETIKMDTQSQQADKEPAPKNEKRKENNRLHKQESKYPRLEDDRLENMDVELSQGKSEQEIQSTV